MSHASKMINFEPPTPPHQGGTVGSQTAYNPGLSYLVGPALYQLMKIWSQISILYQGLVTSVTTSEIGAAKNIASFEVEQGEDMKSQAFAQGISAMVGGGLTLGTGALSFSGDSELDRLDAEQKGTKNYSDMIEEQENLPAGSENSDALPQDENGFNALRDKDSFSEKTGRKYKAQEPTKEEQEVAKTTTRTNELKEEYQTKLRDAEKRVQDRMTQVSNKNNMRMQASTALGQITSGAGTTAGGQYQLEQKKAEAKETISKNAQQVLQGIDSHFRGQVEKMVEAALQIISTLASISHANKANS